MLSLPDKEQEYSQSMAGDTVDNEVEAQDDEDNAAESLKSWKFPKMHLHIHMSNDIRKKGVTRNYNTKPNEQMHGPLRLAYRLQTNFKNVAPQVQLLLCCSGSHY